MIDESDTAADAEDGDAVEIRKTKLILVEGRDEVFFFGALLRHLKRADVQVVDAGGKTGLRKTLKALRNQGGWREVTSVVVVRDADFLKERARETAAQAAWKSVTEALVQCGIRAPTEHSKLSPSEATEGGLRRALPPPTAAIFIAPDGESDGMLEDLCMSAVAQDHAIPCLDAYFECLGAAGIRIAEHRLAKARAHAFLASRDEPDKRVGEAAKKGYWPWEAPAFAPLMELIRSLPGEVSESSARPAGGGGVTPR